MGDDANRARKGTRNSRADGAGLGVATLAAAVPGRGVHRHRADHCTDDTVALAENIQLPGSIDRQTQIDASGTSHRTRTGQIRIESAPGVIGRADDWRERRIQLTAAIGSIGRIVPPKLQLVDLRHRASDAIVGRPHFLEISPPQAAGGDVAEDELSGELRNPLAAVNEAAGDGIAAILPMSVAQHWIEWRCQLRR